MPAYTAFHEPDARRGADRGRDGVIRDWREGTRLNWFGWLERGGELKVSLRLADEPADGTKLRLTVASQAQPDVSTTRTGELADGLACFAPIELREAGYHRLTVEGSGGKLPDLRALVLEGEAAEGARFSDVERRNAASVHLGYPVPGEARDEIEWFYLEVTPKTDPLWSYYMATGWHRGYFGMQVNSPTERRIIFSVWDSGNEAVDRRKVADEDRVSLVGKGEDVHAGGFGNEGTGGHSHLKYAWELGDTVHFLMRAQPEGEATTYTGWFRDSKDKDWRLVSSFRAPRDGRHLHGLYSFNENFAGQNGHERRVCEFGNGWVRTRSGTWIPLNEARFTHDGHGREQRLDRSAGVQGRRFYLANGGFVEDATEGAVTRARQTLTLPGSEGRHPSDEELEGLPKP